MRIDKFVLPDLPWPVSVNKLYADVPYLTVQKPVYNFGEVMKFCKSRKVLSADGRTFKQEVANILNESGVTTRLREFVEMHETVEMFTYLYRPNWRTVQGRPNKNAGDHSNLSKVLEDAIFETLGIDDSCIFAGHPRKVYGEDPVVRVIFTAENPLNDQF